MMDRTMKHRAPHWARGVLMVALCAGLVGCVPKLKGITIRDVDLSLPEQFGNEQAQPSDLDAVREAAVFGDPHLVALVDEALRNNRELQIVRQEMNVANAAIIARRGEVFPKVGLGVGAGVDKVGRYTSRGAADASSEIEPGREVPEHLTDFSLRFSASWEIDIWKKLRNASKAAQVRYLASMEGRRFVVTGLVAEVSEAYYELVALDRQLAVVEENIGLLQAALDAVTLQRQAGRVTLLGVQRFEAELLKNESRRYALQQEIVEAENRLNLLVGRYPQPVVRASQGFTDTRVEPIEPGLPAQLLARRPDVRAAELGLEAADLDVKVARASFFPSLSLDASVGVESFSLLKIGMMPASLLYDAAANLFAPLFNRPELKAEWYAANAEQQKAVSEYEQTVLRAFAEVVTQLSAIDNSDERFTRKARQVDVLKQAIETSNLLFSSARADYLEVLTTRREALEAELELVETKRDQIAARIALYRALGGGWPEPDESTNPQQAAATSADGEDA